MDVIDNINIFKNFKNKAIFCFNFVGIMMERKVTVIAILIGQKKRNYNQG